MIDLSSTGLSIRTTLDLAQGDELELLIEPATRFRAIAWRTARTRSGFNVGPMLSSACSEYQGLVERHASRRPASKRSLAEPGSGREILEAELAPRAPIKEKASDPQP